MQHVKSGLSQPDCSLFADSELLREHWTAPFQQIHINLTVETSETSVVSRMDLYFNLHQEEDTHH